MAGTTLTASAPRLTQRGRKEPLPEGPRWHGQAACRGIGPAVFFPAGTTNLARLDEEQAKTLCASCPARARCLAFAIEHDETYGVWGGLNAEERRALKAASTL